MGRAPHELAAYRDIAARVPRLQPGKLTLGFGHLRWSATASA